MQRQFWREQILRLVLKYLVKPVFSPRFPLGWQRRVLRDLARINLPPRGIQSRDVYLGDISARCVVYRERLKSSPEAAEDNTATDDIRVLLYLHGGAYIVGSPDTHAGLIGHLAKQTEATVWVPDYRLAPEHPFPAALDDALSCYRKLLESGYAASQIAVVGDSAGGGLALALALKLKQMQEPLPARLVLLSPWVDLSMPEYSGEHLVREVMLSRARLTSAAANYSGRHDNTHPLISVINGDFAGLPPTMIQVGSDEMLLDDTFRLTEKMLKAGVEVSREVFPGMWHVFQLHAGTLKVADQALIRVARFLKA